MFRIISLRSISVNIQPRDNIPFMKAEDFEFPFSSIWFLYFEEELAGQNVWMKCSGMECN